MIIVKLKKLGQRRCRQIIIGRSLLVDRCRQKNANRLLLAGHWQITAGRRTIYIGRTLVDWAVDRCREKALVDQASVDCRQQESIDRSPLIGGRCQIAVERSSIDHWMQIIVSRMVVVNHRRQIDINKSSVGHWQIAVGKLPGTRHALHESGSLQTRELKKITIRG